MPSRRAAISTLGAGVACFLAGCAGTDGADESDPDPDAIELVVVIDGPAGEETLFETDDIVAVDSLDDPDHGGYFVPIEITEAATETVIDTVIDVGAADEPQRTVITQILSGAVDLELEFGLGPNLAAAIADGEWAGEFLLHFDDRETAEMVRDSLIAQIA